MATLILVEICSGYGPGFMACCLTAQPQSWPHIVYSSPEGSHFHEKMHQILLAKSHQNILFPTVFLTGETQLYSGVNTCVKGTNHNPWYSNLAPLNVKVGHYKKQKWCQFLENLHKYSLKYIGFNRAKQIMGYHACFWDILTKITHEIRDKTTYHHPLGLVSDYSRPRTWL